jgi:ferredoxin
MKIPIVELSDCILCGVCTEACPTVFKLNETGYIEVIQLSSYPEDEVNEAVKNCPTDCIYWEYQ